MGIGQKQRAQLMTTTWPKERATGGMVFAGDVEDETWYAQEYSEDEYSEGDEDLDGPLPSDLGPLEQLDLELNLLIQPLETNHEPLLRRSPSVYNLHEPTAEEWCNLSRELGFQPQAIVRPVLSSNNRFLFH